MSDERAVVPGDRPVRRGVVALRAGRWLSLVAAPTFAAMAALTAALATDASDVLCAPGHGHGTGGMISMYLLMSTFHAAPWLKLVSERLTGWRRC